MKSSNKHIPDLKRSLTKRAVSSRKQSQQPTPRTRYDPTTTLTKSNTLRLLSAKHAKVNNYLLDLPTFQKMLANPKIVVKKRTVKAQQRNMSEQLLLKRSDKMKLIFWNQDPNLVQLKPIILSADIIVNQDCFWDRGEDNKLYEWKHGKTEKDHFIKIWKLLHREYFVIWIVRNRKSWARVQAAVSGASLPVHALFLLRRKRNYTVDYTSVFREMERQRDTAFSSLQNRTSTLRLSQIFREDSLIIFQTIKVNTKDVAVYQSYLGKVPILFSKKGKVILMRIENDPPGLDSVLRCLQKCEKEKSHIEGSSSCWKLDKINSARRRTPELFLCAAIHSFINQYLASLLREEEEQILSAEKGNQQDWFYEEDEIDGRINEMKAKLIQSLISNHGRNYQFQGGLSIYNFVGEMFKRNHKILSNQLVQSQYCSERKRRLTLPAKAKEIGEIDLRLQFYQMEWM